MNDTPTPRTDAKMFPAWGWDTHTMEYVPHGIGFPADDARKLERELTAITEQRDMLAEALREIKNELGVPQPEYPAPVTNAVKIATTALQSLTPNEL
jgi:hypothetical protein